MFFDARTVVMWLFVFGLMMCLSSYCVLYSYELGVQSPNWRVDGCVRACVVGVLWIFQPRKL